jgi:phage shock protein B
MSALFLAIPLTIFVLFVLPIWLWLHYSNRSSRGELSQSEQQRLVQLSETQTKCANAFRRWKRSLMRNIRTGGIVNVRTESE